jgi:hypothetical protein
VCHVSLPSSYRSRRGHIHLPQVLPLVGCRSKTPTAGASGRGACRRSHGELDGFSPHQANCRFQPRRHLRLRLLGLHRRRRWLLPAPPHHDTQLLTDKRRIHLRSASVRTYTFFTTGFPRFLSIRGARGLQAFDLLLLTNLPKIYL